jgi:hypothetical protein
MNFRIFIHSWYMPEGSIEVIALAYGLKLVMNMLTLDLRTHPKQYQGQLSFGLLRPIDS